MNGNRWLSFLTPLAASLAVLAIVGLIQLGYKAKANEERSKENHVKCEKASDNIGVVAGDVGVIKNEIDNIKKSQTRTEKSIEKILEKIDKIK